MGRAPSDGDRRTFTVGALAASLGGALELAADAREDVVVTGVNGIDEAGSDQVTFVSNRRYVARIRTTRAAAVLLDSSTDACGRTAIRLPDPYVGFARALALFHPPVPVRPGVDARAVVAPDAVVEGAEIGALAWVGPGAFVGRGTRVEPGAYVGAGARVGEDCRLMPHAVVCDGCVVGDRVILNPGAVVGGEGFGFAPTPDGHVKIPQTGRAVLESDVEVGSNACIDRAAVGDTLIRRGAKLDNLVQVGHAAEVGEHSLLVAFAGVAGSTRLGRFVTLAAKAGVLGHLRIGDRVVAAARSMVAEDLPDGARVAGQPAIELRRWRRAVVVFKDLPDLARTVARLEARLAALEAGRGGTDTDGGVGG